MSKPDQTFPRECEVTKSLKVEPSEVPQDETIESLKIMDIDIDSDQVKKNNNSNIGDWDVLGKQQAHSSDLFKTCNLENNK